MIAKNEKLDNEALAILSYLYNNPNSMDTIEGLLHWWMLEQHIKSEKDSLKNIINELVDLGFICKEMNKYSNKIYYRLNKESSHKIQALLTEEN